MQSLCIAGIDPSNRAKSSNLNLISTNAALKPNGESFYHARMRCYLEDRHTFTKESWILRNDIHFPWHLLSLHPLSCHTSTCIRASSCCCAQAAAAAVQILAILLSWEWLHALWHACWLNVLTELLLLSRVGLHVLTKLLLHLLLLRWEWLDVL